MVLKPFSAKESYFVVSNTESIKRIKITDAIKHDDTSGPSYYIRKASESDERFSPCVEMTLLSNQPAAETVTPFIIQA